jgi:hypothetical protein
MAAAVVELARQDRLAILVVRIGAGMAVMESKTVILEQIHIMAAAALVYHKLGHIWE